MLWTGDETWALRVSAIVRKLGRVQQKTSPSSCASASRGTKMWEIQSVTSTESSRSVAEGERTTQEVMKQNPTSSKLRLGQKLFAPVAVLFVLRFVTASAGYSTLPIAVTSRLHRAHSRSETTQTTAHSPSRPYPHSPQSRFPPRNSSASAGPADAAARSTPGGTPSTVTSPKSVPVPGPRSHSQLQLQLQTQRSSSRRLTGDWIHTPHTARSRSHYQSRHQSR